MWDVVLDIVFLQFLDMLPRRVRIGCLTVLAMMVVGFLLWLWIR